MHFVDRHRRVGSMAIGARRASRRRRPAMTIWLGTIDAVRRRFGLPRQRVGLQRQPVATGPTNLVL